MGLMTMKHYKFNILYLGGIISLALWPIVPAQAVSLKEHSIITGDKITLGDVFYDLARDQEKVLGNAPRPGQEMVLNSRTLLRIALATGLDWRPSGVAEKITLRREATIIPQAHIETTLKSALEAEGIIGEFALKIPEEFHSIFLPSQQPATLEVSNLTLDSDRKSFSATLSAPSAQNPIQTLRVNGQIEAVMDVPVLRANLQGGSVISEADIAYIKLRDSEFTEDMITDANKLIGMTPRRMIAAGRPMKNSDIIAKNIVERGKLVMMSFQTGALSLTTEAKALDNGARGDVIRVLNTASNQTVQATVIGENQVSVTQN